MGVTQFADLTHAEFMEMLTLRVPDMASAKKPYQMESKVMATSVDWRDEVISLHFVYHISSEYTLLVYLVK